MRQPTFIRTSLLLILAALLSAVAVRVPAQVDTRPPIKDEPTAYQPPDQQPVDPEPSGAMAVLQAACWYPFNRAVDLLDVGELYFTIGDGMGINLRMTQLICFGWFEDDAYGLGLGKRVPPFFGQTIRERYFGFLAAHEGTLDRDPTELGLSFHIMFVGFNMGLSIGEAADFATGFIGVDLAGDDHGPFYADRTTPEITPDNAPSL